MPGDLQLYPDLPDAVLKEYLQSDAVAIDTELQGLRLGRDQVCLVQLCDRKGNVSLVRPKGPGSTPNLERLMADAKVAKVFHFALTDVAFLQQSLNIRVNNYHCTKVMSKLVRTYTNSHGLKDLVGELVGLKLDKENQQTNWGGDLSPEQMKYAANDVIHLLQVFDKLNTMIKARGKLPSGITCEALSEKAQAFLPTLVELLLNGYGDLDNGWDTTLFNH